MTINPGSVRDRLIRSLAAGLVTTLGVTREQALVFLVKMGPEGRATLWQLRGLDLTVKRHKREAVRKAHNDIRQMDMDAWAGRSR